MITRVSIQNFKTFTEAELNLTSLNLFTGLNGTGKSTLIQTLLILRQSNANSNHVGLILKGGKNGIIDLGKGKDIYNINASSENIAFEIDEDFHPLISFFYTYEADNDILTLNNTQKNFNTPSKDSGLFNNRFTYLKADRMSPEHIYKANFTAVKQDRFLGYRGENVPLYIALHKLDPLPLPGVIHKQSKANNLISNLDAWLNEISPGTHVNSTYFNDLDIVKMGYQFENGDELTPEFSPVNVGFGITYLLPVLTAILMAQKGDLIIIENPEAHLHPQGQAKVGELLALAANEGVQIIVESHSDHIFNGIRIAVKNKLLSKDDISVFYFERDLNIKEHVTRILQPIIDEDGRIDQKINGFFDEYSKQLDQLI